MPEHLTISLLGQIDIRLDDAPVDDLTGKTLALLSYLAVAGGPHPRPALWPACSGVACPRPTRVRI